MLCPRWIASCAVLVTAVAATQAEPRIEKRDEANLVIVGDLQKIAAREEKIGDKKDGVQTHYEAELKVSVVDKGQGVQAGDTLKFTWSRITKAPSSPYFGGSGHDYQVAKGNTVQVHLMKRRNGALEVLYNKDGMVKK